jgi:hypothetical protein
MEHLDLIVLLNQIFELASNLRNKTLAVARDGTPPRIDLAIASPCLTLFGHDKPG